MQSQQQGQRNRYPGVKPFTSEEKELFFGREKDVAAFNSLLFIKQTIVLYGKSGYGKSSLLNAGVIPRLEEEGEWCCYSIRFNNFSERDTSDNVSPMENIKLRLRQGLHQDDTEFLDRIIPGEDSFWYWVKSLQAAQKHSNFIFFFDQFEELFTYPRVNIEEFSEQLSQLLYNTVPAKFRKRLAEMDEHGEISDDVHQLLFEKPAVKVVFSVRSDRLALLNSLTDRHPTILQNYYELDALTREEAAEAIIKPAGQPQSKGYATPSFGYTGDAIEKILDGIANVQDSKIETSTLQIVCRYVEIELVGEKHAACITADQLGNISEIFREYYEGILSKLSDVDREKVQRLIEDELIEEGHRNTLAEGYIRNRFGFDGKLLRQLEQSSLLRKERDAAGRILYEISHDTLVGPIEMVAKGRRELEREQQRQREAAEEEEKQQKLLATLAEEQEKARKLSELNKDLSEFSRQVRRRSRLAMSLAFMALLACSTAIYFGIRARNERNVARQISVILTKSNLDRVRNFQEAAKIYMASHDYDLARTNLKVADSLLVAMRVILPETSDQDRMEFKVAVDSGIAIFNQLPK